MGNKVVSLLMVLALAVATGACGDDAGSGADSLFTGAPGTLPDSLETIVIESGGESFELPSEVCLRADGDADILLAAAQQQAAEVRSLVGHLISGWPTTTWAQSFDYEAYERDLQVAAVTALALAGLLGEQAALEDAWVEYEQSHADPQQGWGAPNEISGRVEAWKARATELTAAIAAHCSGE